MFLLTQIIFYLR